MEITSLEFQSAVQFPFLGRWKVGSYLVNKAWSVYKTTWRAYEVSPEVGKTQRPMTDSYLKM